MDINNDLQQINTFVKGMNTDVSDALMDSSQYRYAENVRLATNTEENTGELRLIEGNKIYSDLSNFGKIKAFTSVRDMLIVVADNDNIYVKDVKNDDRWNVVFVPKEGEKFGDHLSLVTRWESNNNVKLYIADGEHLLMYINIADKDDNGDYITREGIESISGNVDSFIKPATIKLHSNTGNLNAPKVLYAYRLYTLGGATTTLSPLSNMLVLYKSDNKGYETFAQDVYKVNKSVQIIIPANTTPCEYILIFRIAYINVGDNPDVLLIYDDKYISSYVDAGYNIQSVDYTEFLSYIKFNVVSRVIESKNDYMFAANIKDKQTDIDSIFDKLGDMKDYITLSEDRSKTVYINIKNEKRYSITSGTTQDQIKSLRPGEKYRYGVVLYDDKGNHTSAKYLDEITVDSDYNIISTEGYYTFNLIGVKAEIRWGDLLAVYPECTAVEIVRCSRTMADRYTITQGIAGYPLMLYDKKEDAESPKSLSTVCSTGILSTNKFLVVGNIKNSTSTLFHQNQIGVSDGLFLLFASPEYVYLKDDIQNAIQGSTVYITKDATATTGTTNTGYSLLDINELRTKRIKSYMDTYDHGVPYRTYRTPNSIDELYGWIWTNVNVEDGAYLDSITGTNTFIHTAPIGAHFAEWAWNIAGQSVWHPYINNVELYSPKVYVSASQYDVSTHSPIRMNVSDNIGYAEVPLYDSLFDGTTFIGSDHVSLGPAQYINWTIPIAFGNDTNSTGLKTDDGYIQIEQAVDIGISSGYGSKFLENQGQFVYPMGSTGECIILKQEEASNFIDDPDTIYLDVVSIKHDVEPYGGESTKDLSTYTSFGDVILNGTNSSIIYDGDCYPGVFVYNASHTWYEGGIGGAIAQANVLIVPLYSDIDLSATFGDLFPNITQANKYWFQDVAVAIDGYMQDKDAYMYNTSYGADPNAVYYTSIKYTELDTDTYDTRVFYSHVKTNNEHIDSWLLFSPLDYIDVDSRFGQITNMRLFKDRLLFWQERAAGILSANERTVLNDVDNNNIIVGSGGVLSRYDYISTIYGMKPFLYEAETQSNTTQYWWDGHNKEILAYGGGTELIPLTKVKGVTNYINQRSESNRPALMYDTKYDEIIASVVGEDSLVYNELTTSFSSVYTFMPLYRTNVGNDLYVADELKIYIQDKQDLENYSKLFNKPAFPKVRIVVNKNNIYTKTFDNLTFGGRMYKGSLPTIVNWPMLRGNGEYIKEEHLNAPMHHLIFTFETPLKQKSAVRGDKATSVDEYDYRLAIPRNGSNVEYGNRMRGKTMQCEIASDYNSTDFSLQYITTKFRMSWS